MEAKLNVIKVLIAEDNAAYRQSLFRMLQEEKGIKVLEPARDGREAVEKSERFQPDVVLMDIDMPEQGGLWATRTIRERWPQVKVIILSFHSGEAFRDWAEEVGAVAFLPKDADPEEIVQAIRTAGDATSHLYTMGEGLPTEPSSRLGQRPSAIKNAEGDQDSENGRK